MDSVLTEKDEMTLTPPRWFSTIVSGAAEIILIVVTIVIIAAMWLPAYLVNSGKTSAAPYEPMRGDRMGFSPRGR